MPNKTYHYLFIDNETGEIFYVDAPSKNIAVKTAKEYFSRPVFQGVDNDYAYEFSGYDVY